MYLVINNFFAYHNTTNIAATELILQGGVVFENLFLPDTQRFCGPASNSTMCGKRSGSSGSVWW